jgi:hypothetical protein
MFTGARCAGQNFPSKRGRPFALLASHFGVWSLQACRIVYVLEENGDMARYGFAYGTLPEHGVMGEERFSVAYHPQEQSPLVRAVRVFAAEAFPEARISICRRIATAIRARFGTRDAAGGLPMTPFRTSRQILEPSSIVAGK